VRGVAGGLGVVLLAFGQATPAVHAQAPPIFRVDVENVNLDVLVTRGGRPVESLTAADFAVTDNGVPQRIEIVERQGTAVDAVLALDASSSVRGERLHDLRAAAHAFVDALWPADSVTVIVFGTDLALESRPLASRAETHAAIERVEGMGATVLVDAVYAALLMSDPRRGRPLVLVFSDGVDRGSWLEAEAVLAAARGADAVVHFVEVDGDSRFLKAVARETGGRGWSARRGESLRSAFVEALDEFKSRYRLRYEPTGVAHGGWHALQVKLKGKKGTVRARRGYEVPGGDGAR
jgi:VWFA-related protein